MMKKYKRFLSLMLAVLLLLSACGTVPPDPTNTNTEPTKATEATEYIPPFATRPIATDPDPATVEMKIGCQYLPETVDNPDNLPVLKWVCLNDYSDGRVWSEAAAIEVNQMLAERNMPFRVQFVIYTTDYYYHNLDWFVRPEPQADIATADLLYVHSISAERAEDYYMPLTEYAKGNATPSLKNAVPHEINWQKTSVSGEVYGISQRLVNVYSKGWTVDEDVLSEHGMTFADFQKNYWEMDETLKKLNEASGNRQLIRIPLDTEFGIMHTDKIWSIYPGIAGDAMDSYFTALGSVFAVEYVNNVPTVVNMLDTEITQTILDAVLRYKEKYGASDNGKTNVKLFADTVLCDRPYRRVVPSIGETYWDIPVSAPYYNAGEHSALKDCSGVAAASKYQKEAVTLLSLIAEDEEFRMQLMYGKEGRDYTIDANGNYSRTKQEDGSFYHMSFLSPWSYFSGMKENWFYLPQYEGMTVLETYLEMIENAEPYYAVPFDFSALQEELNAVHQVCRLYFYRYASLTEEKYAEMLQKIADAGGTKIMTELQRQLDEWVKANPGKPVTPNRQ